MSWSLEKTGKGWKILATPGLGVVADVYYEGHAGLIVEAFNLYNAGQAVIASLKDLDKEIVKLNPDHRAIKKLKEILDRIDKETS